MNDRSGANPTLEMGRALINRLPPGPAGMARSLARKVRPKKASAPSGPTSAAVRNPMVIPDASTVNITDPGSDHAYCPMCGLTVDAFEPFGVKAIRPDCLCPRCSSLERHRLVWLFFSLRTDLLTREGSADGTAERVSFLHIAPEPPTANRLKQIPHIDYLSADLEPGKAMEIMDITSIDRPDDVFDVIFASHVLEHIPDDVKAMSELRRVLRPDGWAVLEVPIHGAVTREDLSITDPAERERLFGQTDHVRMYGRDGEYERRLKAAGFDVTVVRLTDELGPAAVKRFRLRPDEHVYLCRPAR